MFVTELSPQKIAEHITSGPLSPQSVFRFNSAYGALVVLFPAPIQPNVA
jgi:hypothetical protein